MITLKKYGKTYNMAPLELSGLSTDYKPINNYQTYTIVNGSIFEEIDTGNTYKYDAENDTWKLQPKTAGGADGITPLLKKTDTAIQVSYNNGDSWEDLVQLSDITGPEGPKGETGEAGAQGPAGADGSAATIRIGEVTTGAAGSQASVTNEGTENAAILNFSIPQGAAGTPGTPGQDGEDGADGTPGAAGADGASITGITLTLTKDGEGAITGGSGTATLSTGGPIEFTVNVSEAGV